MTRSRAPLALLVLAAALAGCGKQGDLQRPHPLSGRPATATTAQADARDAAHRALADGAAKSGPRAPASIDELREIDSTRHKAVQTPDAADPSAPHPPGSPQSPDAQTAPAPQ